MAVHGPGSLAVQAAAWLSGKISPSLSFRPGPLHRLDKPTSGIVVFSMNLEGARRFSALLRDGSVKKSYLALVDGTIREPLVWEDRLFREKDVQKTFVSDMTDKTGKYAFTAVRPLARAAGRAEYSLILAEIATGRTHQIRAQAAAHGFPLSGDGKYGGSPLEGGLLLHAWTLDFPEGEGRTHIEAPLPERFRKKIETLFPGFRLPQSPAVPCTMPPPAL
jgi:23S rRNA pseudouridine955/2504/2580 synthase